MNETTKPPAPDLLIEMGSFDPSASLPDVTILATSDMSGTAVYPQVGFGQMAARRPINPLIAQSRLVLEPELAEKAATAGVPFFDGDAVDAVHVGRVETVGADGRPSFTYQVTPAPTSYVDFVVSAARLDQPTPAVVDARQQTLRSLWNLPSVTVLDAATLPAACKLGNATVVITADQQLVLGVRGTTTVATGGTDLSGRRRVHVLAEGVEPTDVDATGVLNPDITSLRGLKEELNIGDHAGATGRVIHHAPTGVFFDNQRWQLCFTHVAVLDLTFQELTLSMEKAHDRWENEELVAIPLLANDLQVESLISDTHPLFTTASNHASAALWFTLEWQIRHPNAVPAN